MGQVLHGCATTTEAIRRAIQNSQESLRALAKRYGINQKTVAKWRERETVTDLPTCLIIVSEESVPERVMACIVPKACRRNDDTSYLGRAGAVGGDVMKQKDPLICGRNGRKNRTRAF